MPSNTSKPAKPYPDFPLTWHPSGTWCKKIRGKLHYFGSDAQAAVDKYQEERDDLQAGRVPKSKRPGGISLRDACNLYLNDMRAKRSGCEITTHTFNDAHTTCENLVAFFGATTVVEHLVPDDFARYRAAPGRSGKPRGLITTANLIIRVRSVFNWLFNNDHIAKPVKFGTVFVVPGRAAKKRDKAKRPAGARLMAGKEIRNAIDAARQPLKAMILLGINCAFGQNDCASLPLSAINLDKAVIEFPRPKTGSPRRCPLWPETVKALREVIAERPAPKGPEEAELVFLTHRGAKWVRHQMPTKADGDAKALPYFNDHLAPEFNKLLVKLGIKRRGSFYNLRHAFRTAAGAAKDREAIEIIMGHCDETMGAHYVEDFDDSRLEAVADVVHRWVWPLVGANAAPS